MGTRSAGAISPGAFGAEGSTSIGDGPDEMATLVGINFGMGRSRIEIGGGDFTCARLDDDTVRCWGHNSFGQLGQGNTTPLGVVAGDIAAAPAIDFGAGLTARLVVRPLPLVRVSWTPRTPTM